jgi:hypothetical protein
MQMESGSYLWLGDYDRQVASTMNLSLKGDGRLYGMYMKSDSFFEGAGKNQIWQTCVKTRYAPAAIGKCLCGMFSVVLCYLIIYE